MSLHVNFVLNSAGRKESNQSAMNSHASTAIDRSVDSLDDLIDDVPTLNAKFDAGMMASMQLRR